MALPYNIGSNSANIAVSSIAITTVADVSIGSLIVVSCGNINTGSDTVSTITDNASGGSNTYVKAVGGFEASANIDAEIWYSVANHTLSSGSTITITMTSSVGIQAIAVGAAALVGVMASPLDATPTQVTYASGQSSPTISSGTLAQPTEALFGFVFCFSGNITFTQAAGFTNLSKISNIIGANTGNMSFDYRVVSSTSSVTYNPGLSAGQTVNIDLCSFKVFADVFGFNMPMLGM